MAEVGLEEGKLLEAWGEWVMSPAETAAVDHSRDPLRWHVAFQYFEGEVPPNNLEHLTTRQLHELIRAGKVRAIDYVFQTWRPADSATGELLPGVEPWEKEWTRVKDCPIFAEDLDQAPAASDE